MSLRTAIPRSIASKLMCVASTLLFAWPTRVTLAAQNTQPGRLSTEQTVRVNVNLVTVGALVTDRKNRAMEGLKVSDFEIYEDGRRQQIVSFSGEEQPISLVILLDKSNSMAESAKMEEAKVAALSLLDASHPSNEIAYFAFHNEIFRLVAFTTNHEQVKSAISARLRRVGGPAPMTP